MADECLYHNRYNSGRFSHCDGQVYPSPSELACHCLIHPGSGPYYHRDDCVQNQIAFCNQQLKIQAWESGLKYLLTHTQENPKTMFSQSIALKKMKEASAMRQPLTNLSHRQSNDVRVQPGFCLRMCSSSPRSCRYRRKLQEHKSGIQSCRKHSN